MCQRISNLSVVEGLKESQTGHQIIGIVANLKRFSESYQQNSFRKSEFVMHLHPTMKSRGVCNESTIFIPLCHFLSLKILSDNGVKRNVLSH